MNQDRIGNFIKELRLEKNLTQKEFADILGVTYQAVSKWENGKNVPDIGTMKLISEKFDVNIEEILNGKKIVEKKNSVLLTIIPIIFLVAGLVLAEVFIHSSNNVKFKTMASNCSDFKVTGIAAYNKEKASLSISKVEFCGKEETEKYKNIKCKLYEINDKLKLEISNCKETENVTLKEYLETVNINVNNYSTICKNKNSSLLIEITALNNDNKIINYNIPIKLNEDCK